MRRIAIGRIIGQIIAVVGVCLSIQFVRDALQIGDEVRRAVEAQPMESTIDFSKPGQTVAQFHQTYVKSHTELIYFDCLLDDHVKKDIAKLFAGLEGEIVVRQSGGKIVESRVLNEKNAQHRDGRIFLARFDLPKKGEFVVSFCITHGADALAGTQQRVYAKHFLCGCEMLPAVFDIVLAILSGAIGIVFAMGVFRGTWRYGVWHIPSAPSVEASDGVIGDVSQGLAEFERGEAKPASVDDIMRKIES